jgi:hypothetical protein
MMVVDLLQAMGPELVRRWVAVLLAVDRDDREAVVALMERQVALEYARRSGG